MTARGVVLNKHARTLSTGPGGGQWSIQAKHTRPAGDLDVILGFRPYKHQRVHLFAFRRDQGTWIKLIGSWNALPTAVREASACVGRCAFDVGRVAPLLDLAAGLADFPSVEQAREELAARVEPEREREEWRAAQADDDVTKNQGDDD